MITVARQPYMGLGLLFPRLRGDRGRWIFKGDKSPEHHFLRRGSKAMYIHVKKDYINIIATNVHSLCYLTQIFIIKKCRTCFEPIFLVHLQALFNNKELC